jgi:hypothetical protein
MNERTYYYRTTVVEEVVVSSIPLAFLEVLGTVVFCVVDAAEIISAQSAATIIINIIL